MKKFINTILGNQDGAALILALLVTTVLLVYSLTAIMSTSQGMRTMSNYKLQQDALYSSDSGVDYAGLLISRSQKALVTADTLSGLTITVNTTDSDGKGADLFKIIQGMSAYNALYTASSATPLITMRFNSETAFAADPVNIDVDFSRRYQLAGESKEFASGLEGNAGFAMIYQVDSKNTKKDTSTTVRTSYKCVVSKGRCL